MQDVHPKILLSVAIPVYNHGLYISKALDSVLMQKTDFDFEIVIGDDGSTDNTREILANYKAKYPEKIILLLAENNQGVNKNAINIYQNCHGKYIAMLEGDDHWTYENKLQKQVDFLESHSDYNACFHDSAIASADINDIHAELAKEQSYTEYRLYSQFNHYARDFFPRDLLQRNVIPHASLVFRNSDYLSFFINHQDISLSLNWAIHLAVIKNSKFRYFNEGWSVYNDHPEGVTKTEKSIAFNRSNIRILRKLLKDKFYHTIKSDVQAAILKEYRQILYNRHTYDPGRGLFIKNYFSYLSFSFRLLLSESYYFFQQRLKK